MIPFRRASLQLQDASVDYLTFGEGSRPLVMIPGVGDGLRTVTESAAKIASDYALFAADFTCYLFSRREPLPMGFTSRDMAADVKFCMDRLGIASADVFGVSQGGTIAQYLAIDYPEAVKHLVLAVTYAKHNPTGHGVIWRWIEQAKAGDYAALFVDMTEMTYTDAYLSPLRRLYPMLIETGQPKSFERFLACAEACLTHDAYALLPQIQAPTLILGGEEDRIVTAEASREMAAVIPNSKLYLYPKLGHGAFDEAKDFNRRMYDFFLETT